MYIRKLILSWATAVAVTLTAAYGAEGYLIRLHYDGATARLADTSFVPYAVYDEYAVGEVSVGYAGRLAAQGFRFALEYLGSVYPRGGAAGDGRRIAYA
jgi:hypothetical protein